MHAQLHTAHHLITQTDSTDCFHVVVWKNKIQYTANLVYAAHYSYEMIKQ